MIDRPPRFLSIAAAVALAIAVTRTGEAIAADTVEAFDRGAADLELHLGWSGLGAGGARTLSSETVLGYGLLDGLSICLGVAVETDERLGDQSAAFTGGLIFGLLDRAHVDLDLLLDGGASSDAFEIAPGFELNLDRAPELRAYGLYLRGALIVGRDRAPADPAESGDDATGEATTGWQLGGTLGAYLTLSTDHQLLLELDGALDLRGDGPHELGALALGYNLVFTDNLELLTQLSVDLPQAGERPAIGLQAGLIATLPGS